MVEVVDYSVTGGKSGSLVKKESFDLQVLVQNTQYGKAEDVKVDLSLPPNVVLLSGNEASSIPELKPGETKSIVYSLIVNDMYTGQTIPVTLKTYEKHGKFSKDRTITLTMNQAVAQNKIVVDGIRIPIEQPKIEIGSLTSEVDKNIPVWHNKDPNKFALIIGNEEYTNFQQEIGSEANVAFARNDATIVRDYVVKTLGFDETNVFLLTDATAGKMGQQIDLISKIATRTGDQAEILFYYAGHGLPDEVTHVPYLIPVDVSASSLNNAIRLSDIYNKFGKTGTKKITIILDACFSGGGRTSGLLAGRMVKIKPAEENISGNMVVFSASTGEQSALPYKKEKHGLFTYFLLKKL
jgi:hypothetical protein